MKECKLVSIDLAKNVFQICLFDSDNKVIKNKKVRRSRLLDEMRQLPPTAIVAMEGCSSAHHWARQFRSLGFSHIILVPAQHVKPFVGVQKNDANDARAIGEAALRPNLHPVPIKTLEQQDIKFLRGHRDLLVKQRKQLINHLRGHCAEYGVIMNTGINSFRKSLPEVIECADNELTSILRENLAYGYEELLGLDERIKALEKQLHHLCKPLEDYNRLQQVMGIGPLNAAAIISEIGDGSQFKRGREYAAYLGLVPRQHSSGGKLLSTGITKAGNKQLRTLLVHSARTLVRYMVNRDDPLSRWVNGVIARRGKNKAIVALANKLARICWAVLRYKQPFCLHKAVA